MEEKEKRKKKLITKLKSKYRLVILKDDSFAEKFSLILTPLNVFVSVGSILIVLITAVISFVAFTPLREFIPGYSDLSIRKNALSAVTKADSLEKELEFKSAYLENLAYILEGKEPPSPLTSPSDSTKKLENIVYKKSKKDSILRAEIESADKYELSLSDNKSVNKSISSFFFFTPLNGSITASFNSKENHFGVDIAASENEAIKATNNGTVIFAAWTSNDGYVLQIQHSNNLISSYKHNSVLLKKAGDYVKAGEAVAIIGNSGELSTGPHLHFELWYNGIPVNPQDYISF
jgi:murein DD-endopeptidase MepM/ murein hydrolase activator NlpD